MFSLAEYYWVSENQFAAGSILHPSDHFSFYCGYILSKFHVCCESGKKIRKCSYPLFSPILIFNIHFLYCLPHGERCQQEPVGQCLWASWGFRAPVQALTWRNTYWFLIDGESRLISISDSLLFSCESKPVWNHSTCPNGLFCTSNSSSSQWKLRLHPWNPG